MAARRPAIAQLAERRTVVATAEILRSVVQIRLAGCALLVLYPPHRGARTTRRILGDNFYKTICIILLRRQGLRPCHTGGRLVPRKAIESRFAIEDAEEA